MEFSQATFNEHLNLSSWSIGLAGHLHQPNFFLLQCNMEVMGYVPEDIKIGSTLKGILASHPQYIGFVLQGSTTNILVRAGVKYSYALNDSKHSGWHAICYFLREEVAFRVEWGA